MKMSDPAATKDLQKMIGILKKKPKTLVKVQLLCAASMLMPTSQSEPVAESMNDHKLILPTAVAAKQLPAVRRETAQVPGFSALLVCLSTSEPLVQC